MLKVGADGPYNERKVMVLRAICILAHIVFGAMSNLVLPLKPLRRCTPATYMPVACPGRLHNTQGKLPSPRPLDAVVMPLLFHVILIVETFEPCGVVVLRVSLLVVLIQKLHRKDEVSLVKAAVGEEFL